MSEDRRVRNQGLGRPEVSHDLRLLSRFAPGQNASAAAGAGAANTSLGATSTTPSTANSSVGATNSSVGATSTTAGAASTGPYGLRREGMEHRRQVRVRSLGMIGLVAGCFLVLGGQLVSLAIRGQGSVQSSMSTPLGNAFARPDIVDRKGRLLATDVALPSLYADPTLILDRDEVVETLAAILPEIDVERIRAGLSDKRKRFLWLRRGLSPRLAQLVHNAGLPGLSFRSELKRAYPMGQLGGHLVGAVDVDNKGLSGIERYLDERELVDPVHGVSAASKLPVRLSIDVGAQHALEEELSRAIKSYKAVAASGVVLDAVSGEIVAASSLPGVDPMRPVQWQDASRRSRLTRGAFELGSVFKLMSVGMALDSGVVRPDTLVNVQEPLVEDGFEIVDPHPSRAPLSVREVLVRSSNVGAGVLALETGTQKQKEFLTRLGLLSKLSTEAGPVEPPRGPLKWGRIETVTVSYGHGIAVAPLQFAAASAALVNGGKRVRPSFLRDGVRDPGPETSRVISRKTSLQIRRMMRLNVTSAHGTGRRADVPGYRVGGKTGTAEQPGRGGYKKKSVISSFLAAFPMDEPRYVVLVSIYEPKPVKASGNRITADRNAAPLAGRVIKRIGPLLGVIAKF